MICVQASKFQLLHLVMLHRMCCLWGPGTTFMTIIETKCAARRHPAVRYSNTLILQQPLLSISFDILQRIRCC